MTLDRAAIEEAVLRIAREILERKDVSLDDDFFAAGGDSLGAMYLLGRLREETGIALRVRVLFESSTLRQVVDRVTETVPESQGRTVPPDRARLHAAFDDEV